MKKKYSLTKNKKETPFGTLYQIKAEMSFGTVSKGDLGGWISKEENLSQDGYAWVYGNAQVYGDAWVYDSARVYGNARVYEGIKLSSGDFFGWKEKKEKLRLIKLNNDHELIAKGEVKYET